MTGQVKKVALCGWLLLFFSVASEAQTEKQKWVDSIFHTLGQNEKIGQLFFARLSSHADGELIRDVEKRIESGLSGGIVFTTGSVQNQARLTTALQAEAKIPLLISQDESSGLGTLLDSAVSFPIPLAQAALYNDSLLYRLARETGRQMKAIGVQMSLSPNATPFSSAAPNAAASYGDDVARATRRSLLHMKGLQDAGVLSCAKYFPLKSIEVIDQKGGTHITLYHDSLVSAPYHTLFSHGLNAVMADASDLPLYYELKRTDLKKKASEKMFAQFEAGDLLHKPIGFDGVVIVDLQSLEAASDKFLAGDAGLFAFQTGADLMVLDGDPEPAVKKIRKLIHSEKKYAPLLDQRVKKILALKYDAGLSIPQPIDMDRLDSDLQRPDTQVLISQAYKESITVVKNVNDLLPIVSLEDRNFMCLVTGDSARADIFYRSIRKYVPVSRRVVTEEKTDSNLEGQDVIIAAVFPNTTGKTLYNLLALLQEASPEQTVIIADFGCRLFEPYASRFPVVVEAYTDANAAVGIVPQVIFGGLPGKGILPVAYANIPSGAGVQTRSLDRLTYSFPEDAGIDGITLAKISNIAQEAISSGSTPGCYVLVAKEGKVVFDQAFGFLTYDNQHPVTDETIYDLASLTKVTATLQTVMFMQEHNLIDLHKKLSVYLPELKGTNKKDITIDEILTHQAGLTPFVPLWPLTVEGPTFLPMYYSSQQSVSYPLQIAPSLFGSAVLKDSVWSWVIESKMLDKPPRTPYGYRYSDLGFMMFKQLAERVLNQPMEDFLQQNFYEPLGAYSLGYNPLHRFPVSRIAPTEMDTLFRHGLVLGTVHDERAAMLGGVSGHAGLFGTANDLSKLGQMLLQEGKYGGLRFYKPKTVDLFTSRQFAASRRGLGWDKPVTGEWKSPTSIYCSPRTFGHTGFTGTCLWVDPEFDLVYIFLSNRVFPDRNDKLIQTNIRSRIQDVIYEAIFNFCKTHDTADVIGKSYSQK
jgi:CubicO group peptidase (beta-lactamase class C family)/beta-glucosidase-like glycosyl hydrolase